MNAECLMYGVFISWVVALAKRVPFVGDNPKTVALVLSCLIPLAQHIVGLNHLSGDTVANIIQCAVAQFTASVATHEVVTKPVASAIVG